jgi:hypothetical protein
MSFAEPYKIGLLVKKSDKLYMDVREGFKNGTLNYTGIFLGNKTEHRLTNFETNTKLTLIFDWKNPVMANFRWVSKNMYWVMIGIIITQFCMLILRGIGLLPLWILIEYLQLVSFMPIYNFRLIPYFYDAFKPALVSHMIIFDETPFYKKLDDDFFNKNYEYYWLSVGRLLQSFVFMCLILFGLVFAHFCTCCCNRMKLGSPAHVARIGRCNKQFKYNVYIRYYMLIYFGSTFFSVMKIFEG